MLWASRKTRFIDLNGNNAKETEEDGAARRSRWEERLRLCSGSANPRTRVKKTQEAAVLSPAKGKPSNIPQRLSLPGVHDRRRGPGQFPRLLRSHAQGLGAPKVRLPLAPRVDRFPGELSALRRLLARGSRRRQSPSLVLGSRVGSAFTAAAPLSVPLNGKQGKSKGQLRSYQIGFSRGDPSLAAASSV